MAKQKNPRTTTPKNGSPAEAPLMAAAAETKPEIKDFKKTLPEVRRNIVPINLDEEIRRRAYELWEQRGHEPGHETEHWLIAETEILSRYNEPRQHSA